MNLLIAERMVLLELLPREGDYAALKEIRKTREALSLTADEIEAFSITQTEGRLSWDIKGNSYIKDIPLSEWATTTIQDVLRVKNREKKLDNRTFSLYEKFIVAYDQV